MSKFFVKLIPTGKFFFGGDMRFGVDGKEEEFSSYIIESSKMPQQTSVLGMIRFLLLSNDSDLFDVAKNVIKPGKINDVSDLIGEKGFSVNPSENKFGKIIAIGPCCLYGNNERYYRASADCGFSSMEWGGTEAVINGRKVELPVLKVKDKEEEKLFIGKYSLPSCYQPLGKPTTIAEDEMFIEDTRIGIDKDYGGKSHTNAFYKQISYRLKEGFCFAFEAEVDESICLKKYNGQLVKLGADASTFVFEAENMASSEKTEDTGLSVVLLSDAYIPKEDVEKCNIRFSINQMRPFRFLKTENQADASYYRINGKKTATCTQRYELYQAGSVFYFKDDADRDAFAKVLESREDFNQIGYNKFYIK